MLKLFPVHPEMDGECHTTALCLCLRACLLQCLLMLTDCLLWISLVP